MTETKGTAQIQFRASDLEEHLEARQGHGTDTLHQIAKRDLGRYYTIIRDSLIRLNLTREEACLICDALNGCWMDEWAYRHAWAEVADGIQIQGLAGKWEVEDPDGLVHRLRALSPGGAMALVDAVERFWLDPERDADEMLREVGLLRE